MSRCRILYPFCFVPELTRKSTPSQQAVGSSTAPSQQAVGSSTGASQTCPGSCAVLETSCRLLCPGSCAELETFPFQAQCFPARSAPLMMLMSPYHLCLLCRLL